MKENHLDDEVDLSVRLLCPLFSMFHYGCMCLGNAEEQKVNPCENDLGKVFVLLTSFRGSLTPDFDVRRIPTLRHSLMIFSFKTNGEQRIGSIKAQHIRRQFTL